ncbi:MAG: hypothetical protein JXA58_02530 [Dehalococcoidia bacterium]|nr:hypothetical protein [Dehalococcoidia bacterium]
MTTVVEPERPPHRPRGLRLVLVAVAVVAAGALIIGAASALGQEPSPSADNVIQTAPNSPYLAEASVVLQNYASLTAQEMAFWRDMTLDNVVSFGVPFARYNRYYTRFFLQEGETAEIDLESNVPLGTSLDNGLEGISVMLIAGSAPYDQANANIYLPPTEKGSSGYFTRLERVGGNWKVSWAMAALGSDYYWLILTNTARQDAWCHFTVNVPAN